MNDKAKAMKDQKIKVAEMESLLDPRKDRQVKDVQPPVQKQLSSAILFGIGSFFCITLKGDKPNWKPLLHHFRREGRLEKAHALSIIAKATAIFSIMKAIELMHREGAKCAEHRRPDYSGRRYTWTVLRFNKNIGRRRRSRD